MPHEETASDIFGITTEISREIDEFRGGIEFGSSTWIALCDQINFREAQNYLEERQREVKSNSSEDNQSLLRIAEANFSLAKHEVWKNLRDIKGYAGASGAVSSFEQNIAAEYQHTFPGREAKVYWHGGLEALLQVQTSVISA